jgi:hypothetical protein
LCGSVGVEDGDHFTGHDGGAVGLDDLGETPAAGAGSSSTTLSVSMSIRFSSRATVRQPSCARQQVASATDSDSCGTLTSI